MGCQALEIYNRMGDVWRRVGLHHMLGEITEQLDLVEEAIGHFEANATHFSQMGDKGQRDAYLERIERLRERVCSACRGIERQAPVSPTSTDAVFSRSPDSDLVEALSAR